MIEFSSGIVVSGAPEAEAPAREAASAAEAGKEHVRADGARIARNFGALAFGHVVQNAVGFVAFAYIARVLGPAGFGLINFATAILAYLLLSATMGIPNLASWEIARDSSSTGQAAGDMMVTRFVLAAAAFLVLAAVAPFIASTQQMQGVLLISGASLLLDAPSISLAYAGVERLTVTAADGVVRAMLHPGSSFSARSRSRRLRFYVDHGVQASDRA